MHQFDLGPRLGTFCFQKWNLNNIEKQLVGRAKEILK